MSQTSIFPRAKGFIINDLLANLIIDGCRAFLGSVSDYCAHHANCPILIVKPPKEKLSRESST